MTDAPLTVQDIASAERLAGVALTPAERAQMLDNLEGQILAARARRAAGPFPNALQPACTFDPRLPGVEAPQGPVQALPSGRDPGPLPDDPEAIAFAPVRVLSQWIAAGALTSTRLTRIHLDRIARHAPALGCFVTVTEDLALSQAAQADAELAAGRNRGSLHGIPYGLKDLFDTAGIPTTWGAEPYADRIPDTDATITARLRDAGAVLLGKTATGALAYGDIWHAGRCRNPWAPAEGASGSSAGSAAATAAGLCAFAIGTETLGSITSPSARCGTVGLRPTFGRIPRTGGMALAWSLDKIGPITRDVEDCGAILAALAGPDGRDRACLPAAFLHDAAAPLRPLRLGLSPALSPQTEPLEAAALTALAALPGVTLEPVALPAFPHAALMNTLFAEAAAQFEDLTLTGADDALTWQDPLAWPNAFRKARFLSAVDHVQADRLRLQVMQAWAALFARIDILVGPFAMDDALIASNFTGHPCLFVPTGLETRGLRTTGGLSAAPITPAATPEAARVTAPRGLCLWAGLWREADLLALGQALSAALPPLPRPPLEAPR